MAKESLKDLRKRVEGLLDNPIKNREQLFAAVPTLVEFQNAVKFADQILRECGKLRDKLSECCSEYAVEHVDHVFGETWQEYANGVQAGDVEIDGTNYHLAVGYDGYKRAEKGTKMTQEYLATLPAEWVTTSTKISTSKINAEDPDEETLAQYGLARKKKLEWSEKAEAADFAGGL